MNKCVQYIFLVGAKSIGAYGGYETFVDKLIKYHEKEEKLKYIVACKANGNGCMDETKLEDVHNKAYDFQGNVIKFEYHRADCVKIKVPNIGPAQAIYYDVQALNWCCNYIKKNNIEHPIIYIMACRIGPFINYFKRKINANGGKIFLNPDGHEWKRAKWSPMVRRYWKYSEKIMVNSSDMVVCDSENIEKYIHDVYDRNGKMINTTFIAYGAETKASILKDDDQLYKRWMQENGLQKNNYYLVVGRFVPENNYETMIREFMDCHSNKDFAIITNVNKKFLDELEKKLHYKKDKRIKFVGTVYNQELLKKIRENAFAYMHGHEVGGTNPSLLEALGSTKLNLLLDVGFNKEVARDTAMYWNKEKGNLSGLLDYVDKISEDKRNALGKLAKQRIQEAYSWEFIAGQYYKLFGGNNEGLNTK